MWEKIEAQEAQNKIDDGIYSKTASESHRLKVPGGWIVRTIVSRYRSGATVAQTFVSDPDYRWKLK